MLEFGKATTLVIGIACAAAGLTYVMSPGDEIVPPAAAMPEPVVSEVRSPTLEEPVVEDVQVAEPIMVTSRTSAAVEAGTSHMLLSVERQRGTEFEQVHLHMEPGPGVTVEDVVGLDWKSEGAGGVVDVSDGTARQEIVVTLRLNNVESAELETQISYVESSTGRAVTASPRTQRVATGSRDADVLVDVRIAETTRSVAEARVAAEAGNQAEVEELLDGAQARNAETGMLFRRTGELKSSQREIAAARKELKPKKRVKRRVVKKRGIEIIGGDRP